MRRVVVLALLALTLPIAAWADPITLTNQFGSISVSDSGLSTVGSELTQFDNFQAAKGHSLGTVTYSTGALTSGSIAAGGTFSATGSTVDVIGRGLWAKSLDGWSHGKVTLFAGSFVDTAQYPNGIVWTLTSSKGVNLTYSLTGALQGTLYTGRQVTGTTTQNFFTTKGQLAAGTSESAARPSTPRNLELWVFSDQGWWVSPPCSVARRSVPNLTLLVRPGRSTHGPAARRGF